MLSLTDRAATVIEDILDDAKAGPEAGLRISGATEPSGEAALEFALAPEPAEGDEVVREGAAKVYLDDVASATLEGRTLDISAHDDHYHFTLEESA